jgi:AraC family carnitine catabolism transcriptional activator
MAAPSPSHGKIQETPLAITLVVAPKFSYLSLAILMDGLRVANRISLQPVFDWIVADVTGEPVASSSGLTVTPQARLADIAFAPVAIVMTAYEPEAACTPGLLAWLRRQDRRGSILGCVDTGALALARAGLVEGARIAVHPEVVQPFREEIGEAVLLDRRYAFDGRRLSSAGGFATMDMLLALIERIRGAGLARQVARTMMFETAPTEFTDAAFAAGGVSSLDPRLGRLVSLMQDHLEDPLALDALCARARVDPSTARRLFNKHIGEAPRAYYARLRLERARTLLRYSHLPVAEIAVAAGFSDTASFSHAFKRRYGLAPSRARHDVTGL